MTRVDREAHEARRDEPAAVGVVEVGSQEQSSDAQQPGRC